MTTTRELSEELGIDRPLISLAITVSKNAGIWPGEDLTEKVTITKEDGRVYKMTVRRLSEEQRGCIEGVLKRMGENPRARNEQSITFARGGKERE